MAAENGWECYPDAVMLMGADTLGTGIGKIGGEAWGTSPPTDRRTRGQETAIEFT
jgi:hypothetical protein